MQEGAILPVDRVFARVTIRGRVQGVGYRRWLQNKAAELKVTGWVRNWRDGSVDAVVGGLAHDVEALIGQCRIGPPGARVKEVERHPWEGARPDEGFEIVK